MDFEKLKDLLLSHGSNIDKLDEEDALDARKLIRESEEAANYYNEIALMEKTFELIEIPYPSVQLAETIAASSEKLRQESNFFVLLWMDKAGMRNALIAIILILGFFFGFNLMYFNNNGDTNHNTIATSSTEEQEKYDELYKKFYDDLEEEVLLGSLK